MTREYWRLTIQDRNGMLSHVFGNEEILQHAYKEWLDYERCHSDVERDQFEQILEGQGVL